jgi:hypothetical protein
LELAEGSEGELVDGIERNWLAERWLWLSG